MSLSTITHAFQVAQGRKALPTTLDTAGLRQLGADVLGRSAFTAQGSNAVFAQQLKEIVDELSQGDISMGQARTALWNVLKALGYDSELGGFPDTPPGEVPPAVKGSLQDLMSFQRRDLIIRTQQALMQGAGQKMRGEQPDMLSSYPALELVRVGPVAVARDWPSRFRISGGRMTDDAIPGAYHIVGMPTGMAAFKGDPVWGELGSYENFPDALGVDYSPFYFNSEMGLRDLPAHEAKARGITGPDGETPDEWFAKNPITLSGALPLPSPQISLRGVDPEIIKAFRASTGAIPKAGNPNVLDYSDILAREVAESLKSYAGGTN